MSMPASFRSSVNRSTVAGAHGKPRPFTTSYTLKGSRMLQPSKPPSIPLPSTPSSSSNETPTARPRAHTISSSRLARSSSSSPKDNPQKRHSIVSKTVGRSSPLSKDPATPLRSTNSSSSSSSSSSTPTLTKTVPSSEAGQIGIDIDSASVDELRKALRLRNQHYGGTYSRKEYVENKVAELEKELSRKQSEIKGLSWIVKNEEYDPSSTMQSGSRTPSLLERERSDDSSTRSSIPTPSSFVRLPLHQLRQGEDSGAESNPTSQSEWGSGTSGAEDDLGKCQQSDVSCFRQTARIRAGSDTSEMVSDGPYLGKPNKRSSTSSSFTAASSSPPTSPEPTSVNFPSQNLNPIPESRPSSVVPGSRKSTRGSGDPLEFLSDLWGNLLPQANHKANPSLQ
ncbi:hypothetical protein BDP27DRAFT_1417391 [Rhodocollybia butyracea]|uniref:Uncharacterized protein n=1 Tax=Rhodocollybia butyracea TaxID=206335 RepID=A0A9P5UAN9_9AGAR|nr:hypothetical protein BDP27DRAFT_1417391 [Rhodocollybia butyracea]